jgi:UDPglucose--hexose-1-phosphate uridylyltransferase
LSAAEPRPEIRIDQLTGLRTILAPGRADRPIELKPAERAAADPTDCPFCETNEDKTPPEVWADRPGGGAANGPGWRVRAVPNLYPALLPGEADTPRSAAGPAASAPADPLRASARGGEPDMFASLPSRGEHEVIVSSPRHRTALSGLDEEELAASVAGWRSRIRARSPGHPCVQLIVNEGGGAGASLEHSHAQLYALDFVPVMIARERERFAAYNQRTLGGDLLADVAAEEVRRKQRLVAIDDDAIVLCPWASRSPFELRIVPRRAAARFEEDGEVGVNALGTALGALRERLGEALELNLWVRTAPRGADVFHWHIDILPRIAIKAGFELATGVDINILPPERAAEELRDLLG